MSIDLLYIFEIFQIKFFKSFEMLFNIFLKCRESMPFEVFQNKSITPWEGVHSVGDIGKATRRQSMSGIEKIQKKTPFKNFPKK